MLGNAILTALALTLAADPSAPASGQSNERICRGGGQRTLGSHIRTRRRCLTAEEWQREDDERNRPVQGMQITQGQNDGRAPVNPR